MDVATAKGLPTPQPSSRSLVPLALRVAVSARGVTDSTDPDGRPRLRRGRLVEGRLLGFLPGARPFSGPRVYKTGPLHGQSFGRRFALLKGQNFRIFCICAPVLWWGSKV